MKQGYVIIAGDRSRAAAAAPALSAYFGGKPLVFQEDTVIEGEGGPTAVVLTGGRNDREIVPTVAAAALGGADVYVPAKDLPALAAVTNLTAIGSTDYIRFNNAKKPSGGSKWFMDEFVAAALILLLSLIWLPMFAAIKIDSKGPIIFRQKRLTTGRREFNIYKFRTMFADVPRYQTSPGHSDDIRVTRMGRLLRKLGLDETAQLLNVIKGQMSLVGPRPEMAVIAAAYEPWQNFRFAVKPGITGLWQISNQIDRPIHECLEFDLYYICNRTLGLDIKIFFQTIPILFGKTSRRD